MAGEELPEDWRRQVVEMIRGAAPLDGRWFAGGPVLSPEDQIGVYRDQYQMRLYDALHAEVPGLAALLGDQIEELLRAYLEAHPSRSWTLNRVADRLAGWLQRRGAPQAQVEMARLDLAIQQGFEAAEGAPLRPEHLVGMPRLCLQPHVSALRLRTDVHRFRAQALAGEKAAPPMAGDYPVVVFRRGLKMRHWQVEPGAFLLLEGIGRGLDIDSLLEEAYARKLIDPERLGEQVQGWFQAFAERGLVGPRAEGVDGSRRPAGD